MKAEKQVLDQEVVDKQRKLLYTYWNELEFSKVVDSKSYELLTNSDVKNFIIKHLRDGTEDSFGKDHNLSRRHAFSVKELYDAFTSRSDTKEYTLPNFHFHIKNLLEDGYIKEIAKIHEGRQYIRYYGRTAITFTFNYDRQVADDMRKGFYEPLKDLIQNLHPEMSESQINQLLYQNLTHLKDYFFRFRLWMKDKYPQLYKSKVDLQILAQISGQYSFFHKDLFENLTRIGNLINLSEIMKYNSTDVEKEQQRTSE